jgi:hypothetical protein
MAAPTPHDAELSSAIPPSRQLGSLPLDELQAVAEEFGLDWSRYGTQQELVAAIHQRRQLIASLDRDAMLDVIRWGRRPVASNASREQLAVEIARIKSMRFEGLSDRGLRVLAVLRECPVSDRDDVPSLVKRLKKQEGFFARIGRKRRAMVGALVSKVLGESVPSEDYQFLPPQPHAGSGGTAPTSTPHATGPAAAPGPRQASIREEIEESGLIGGLTSRIKRSADTYVNQKLDEIEARIDRKLDEIDRRLAEWRDKEIANRLRILKITLWVSVIVAAVSLIYMYFRVVVFPAG